MRAKFQTMRDDINRMEEHFFVGRESQLHLFEKFISGENGDLRLVNIFGTGGMGKTYLLNEFQRRCNKSETVFLLFDSRDVIHTPEAIAKHILRLLPSNTASTMEQTGDVIEACIGELNRISKERRNSQSLYKCYFYYCRTISVTRPMGSFPGLAAVCTSYADRGIGFS
jgi:hypothetical protein